MKFPSVRSALAILASIAMVAPLLGAGASVANAADDKKFPEWDTVVKDAKRLDGLFPLYFNQKDQKLYLELREDQFDKDIICPIAIARGTGNRFLGGDTLNFGDQWVLNFRRAADRILVIRKNTYFRAKGNSPEADAVKLSYTDSVISALPIKSEKASERKVLLDLADLFMTDLAGLGITPDRNRSTWAAVKAFPKNIEIQVSAVFSMGSSPRGRDNSAPDPRGAQVVLHYGLSMLPQNDYKPRLADDRVGHFLSVVKDYSTDTDDTAFVRYATRWDLRKSDPSAEKSLPTEPIIFWIEKTVPRQYRPYIRAGILEWNKAFEKIGFIDAIQVRDQQSEDDFDPEDIRFNTFRWITTSAGFAMGPSRANPKTGQILDADILFDEAMVRYWRQEHVQINGLTSNTDMLQSGDRRAWLKLHAGELPWLDQAEPILMRTLRETQKPDAKSPTANMMMGPSVGWERPNCDGCDSCLLGPGMNRQLGMLASVLAAQGGLAPGGKVPQEFIGQAVKEVVMHEVGHTLGLRHNFKASTMLDLKQVNDPAITREKGMAGSVMDYLPAHFAPKGQKQGDYFMTTIGPYDYWAIEYAYKPISGDEGAELAKIAARVAEPELTFGTDEDLHSNPDPRINLFDLGDPLEYAKQRIEMSDGLLKGLAERVVVEGEGWQRAREAFSNLLGEYSRSTHLAVQYVGSEYTTRDHRGDPNGRPPYKPVAAAKQREALEFLKTRVLSDKAFQFPPELLTKLAPEHWSHWGMSHSATRQQYPVRQQVLSIQRIVLSHLFDPDILRSLQNIEMHAGKDEEVLKMPEIFEALTGAIWSELTPPNPAADKPAKVEISAMRRDLQREHFRRLSQVVLGPRGRSASFIEIIFFDTSSAMPADARSLARKHLRELDKRIGAVLGDQKIALDAYSRAHLEEIHDQAKKVLDASISIDEI